MLNPPKLHEAESADQLRGSFQVIQAYSPKELIEDYLDHVCQPLVGVIPFAERSRFREEAQFHLERLQQSFVEECSTPSEAALKAIEAYGEADKVSDDCIKSYLDNRIQSPALKTVGTGNFIAFSIFGVAQILYTALLQLHVFLPSGEAYRLPVSPAAARMLLPEPFPIPQSWGDFLLLYGFPFIAPAVAGFVTGWTVPVQAARSVLQAMLPIIIYSFVVGSFMVPMTAGLLFAIFQALYWVPVGCLFASVGTTFAQRRAVRRKKLAIFRRGHEA